MLFQFSSTTHWNCFKLYTYTPNQVHMSLVNPNPVHRCGCPAWILGESLDNLGDIPSTPILHYMMENQQFMTNEEHMTRWGRVPYYVVTSISFNRLIRSQHEPACRPWSSRLSFFSCSDDVVGLARWFTSAVPGTILGEVDDSYLGERIPSSCVLWTVTTSLMLALN